jgi:hypothetical protein
MVSFDAGISGVSRVQYTSLKSTAGSAGKTGSANIRSDLMNFSAQTLGITRSDMRTQSALSNFEGLDQDLNQELVYEGQPISDLTPGKAADLISKDGYFGVAKTSQRISDFVINLAGNDPDKLRVGREAVLQGFKEAETLWGGQLPDISYQTLDTTLAAIDERIQDMGGSVVDVTA